MTLKTVALWLLALPPLAAAAAAPGDADAFLQLGGPRHQRSKGCSDSNQAESPASPLQTITFTWQEEDLPSVTRMYHVWLPDRYDRLHALPVVLFYHGWGDRLQWGESDVLSWHRMFSDAAQQQNVIMVYPVGLDDCATAAECKTYAVNATPVGKKAIRRQGDVAGIRSWNGAGTTSSQDGEGQLGCVKARQPFDYCYSSCSVKKNGGCNRCDWTTCYDDVGFTRELLRRVKADFCVDTERVYAAGCSNGGMFMHELAKAIPGEFTAFASVCGGKPHLGWKGFDGSRGVPVPYFLSTGRSDHTLPREVPPRNVDWWDGFLYMTEETVMEGYAHRNGCQNRGSKPRDTRFEGCNRKCWVRAWNCDDSVEVVSCDHDGDHGVCYDEGFLTLEFLLSYPRRNESLHWTHLPSPRPEAVQRGVYND